ncbi:MAG TPA: hypothetical protein VF981_16050 [Gemmatimonadaceae bacterium]|jgi:hypothetical protein
MPLRLGLTHTNEIVLTTSDGEVIIRRSDDDPRAILITATKSIDIKRRPR